MKPILPIAIICWSQMELTGLHLCHYPLAQSIGQWRTSIFLLSFLIVKHGWRLYHYLCIQTNMYQVLIAKLGKKKFADRKTHQCLIATIACWYCHVCECDRNTFKHPKSCFTRQPCLNNCWMLTVALTWLLIASPILCIGVLGLHPARQAPSNWSPQGLVSRGSSGSPECCVGAPEVVLWISSPCFFTCFLLWCNFRYFLQDPLGTQICQKIYVWLGWC